MARLDSKLYAEIAEQLSVNAQDVSNVIHSFFDTILIDARRLPFNDRRKIFSKDAFLSKIKIYNIPYIGRLGPSYSRYLAWRKNESPNGMKLRSFVSGKEYSQQDIEQMADAILSGKDIPKIEKRKMSDLYDNVWIVSEHGKRLARQVINKDKNNVQD